MKRKILGFAMMAAPPALALAVMIYAAGLLGALAMIGVVATFFAVIWFSTGLMYSGWRLFKKS